jgi:hypothetical protein
MASNENTEMTDTPRTNNYDWSFHLLFAEAQKMERELNAANERIKRLEEAGDAHMEWVPVSFQSAWRKAKEAKP